jgi:vitamin B12 transporter
MSLSLFQCRAARGRLSSAIPLSFLLMACAADPAMAQQQVTVTATRTPTRLADVVADITVISREELQRSEARTLPELLSQQAGLQFSSNGGLGKTASVFIRGLEARHTLLLVDGVRIGSATVGSPSLDNLPLESIERIEIVRGPMSSLYGNGAFGGVIQVFTRQAPQGTTGNAKLAAGSNGYGQAAAGMGFGTGSFDAALQLQNTATRGFSATNPKVPFGSYNDDRDGFRQTGGSLRLGWQPLADWRFEFVGLQSKGVTKLDDGPGADARAGIENRFGVLSARGKVLPGWTTRISASEATDVYDTLATASAFTPLGKTQSRSRQLGWENTVATPLGSLLLLAERTDEAVSRPGAQYTVRERTINALALGLSGTADAHAWQTSLRRDRNSQFGGITTGALAYGYTLTPAWRLGASYGTSQTLPSFNQLYFPGFGNPNLIPEEGKHAELSLRWTQGEHSVRAAVYDYRYRNFISSGPQPPNLPKVKIKGLTVAYAGRWMNTDVTASLDHTDPRNATNGSANRDKQLQRRAKDALRLGADHQLGAWRFGATLAAFSHRFDDAANTVRLGGYATLDLRGEVALSRDLALGLRLNNLGGKVYETVLGYNQPGREGFLTLRYALR